MKKRLKILQLQPKCDVRSADLQEEIVNAFPLNEFEVTNAYFHGRPDKTGIHSACERVHYFDFTKSERKGLRIRLMWKLWKFCQDEKFDVLITHRFKPLDVMLKLNKFLRIPRCIAVIHGFGDFDRNYRKKALRKNNSNFWRYVAVSSPVQTYLQELDNGVIKKQVVLINNALNIDKITSLMLPKQVARTQLGLHQNDFVFGTIGRLVGIKGHINLIQAFHKMHHGNPNVKLVIIGEGKERATLEEYIKSNQLEGVITLTGEIINANRFIKALDIFVLPSLKEGFGMVLLEAMAGKIPCIASKTGGIPFVLADKGLLINPSQVQNLSQAMKHYFELSDKEREELGKQLHSRLQNNFSILTYRESFKTLASPYKTPK